MDTEPKKQEPDIVPPAPVVEPPRNVPEIPPDKDTPEKRNPVQAKAGLIAITATRSSRHRLSRSAR